MLEIDEVRSTQKISQRVRLFPCCRLGISLNCKAEKIRIRINSTTASVKHYANINNLSLALQLRRFLRH